MPIVGRTFETFFPSNVRDFPFTLAQVEHKFVKVNKNVYTEFSEFSRKEIKENERKFKQ